MSRRWVAAVLLSLAPASSGAAAVSSVAGQPSATSAAAAPIASDPIVLMGDTATFDAQRQVYELHGQASVKRGTAFLTADRVLYQHGVRFLQASGRVRFSDPRIVLTAGVLEYDTGREWLSARQSPRAVVQSTGRAGTTTLTATALAYDRGRQRMTAEGDVVTRVRPAAGAPYQVTSRELESFMAEQRSVFRGAVAIRSPELGAEGDRAIFYEKSEKLHLSGQARAWKVDASGRPGRMVEGNRLIHDTRTGRTIALERAVLHEPGAPPRSPPAPAAANPGAQPKKKSGAGAASPRPRRTLRIPR